MKPFKLLLCLMMVMPSSVLLAQKKGEMPFSSTSTNANDLIRKGWSHFFDAKMDEGNVFIRQALQEDPNCGMAYVSLWSPDEKELNENLSKAEGTNLSPDERIFLEGLKARRDKKPAEDYLTTLTKKYPKDESLHLLIMYFLHQKGPSVEIGQNLIRRNPKLAPAYNLLGYEYMARNDMAKAGTYFDKYISLRPDLANPYDSKGDYLMAVGNLEEAVALYEKAASMGMKASATKAEAAKARLKFPKPSDDDIAVLKAMVMARFETSNTDNAEGLLKDYADQAVEVFANQRSVVGLPNVRKRIALSRESGSYHKNFTIGRIHGNGSIAVANGKTDIVWTNAAGEPTEQKRNTIVLLRKQNNDAWKILAALFAEDVQADDASLREDRESIMQLLTRWEQTFPQGQPSTEKNIVDFEALYSQQAVEILPNQIANVGIANLRARWASFIGSTMQTNNLNPTDIEIAGRRAIVTGVGNQHVYPPNSKELQKFQFPWAMILTKEKDDVWRILALHWAN